MFSLEGFLSDCRAATGEDRAQSHVHEIVTRAISDPAAVLRELGEPERAEMQTLYRADNLTVLKIVWAPWMSLLPHNHQMWAVIGIYTGREDNIFWRRIRTGNGHRIEAAGAKALSAKDGARLGQNIIHSVTNPIPRLTAAIHVYGGDFFGVPRSEWDSETLLEQSCDGKRMACRFEDANKIYEATRRIGS